LGEGFKVTFEAETPFLDEEMLEFLRPAASEPQEQADASDAEEAAGEWEGDAPLEEWEGREGLLAGDESELVNEGMLDAEDPERSVEGESLEDESLPGLVRIFVDRRNESPFEEGEETEEEADDPREADNMESVEDETLPGMARIFVDRRGESPVEDGLDDRLEADDAEEAFPAESSEG
jgi:hypothetical protein